MEESSLNPNVPSSGEGVPMGIMEGMIGEPMTDQNLNVPLQQLEINSRDFLDMVDLYQTAVVTQVHNNDEMPLIKVFCGLYEKIGQGCGCTRNKRVKKTEEAYLDLVNMEESEQVLLKNALAIEKVRMFMNGGLFSEF
jgi:hypothetical protein